MRWWLRGRSHARFLARELTSLGPAGFSLLLLGQLWALAHGPETYARWLSLLRSPLMLLLQAAALLLSLLHSVTWLRLVARSALVRLRPRPSEALATSLGYLAWIAASALVVCLVGLS